MAHLLFCINAGYIIATNDNLSWKTSKCYIPSEKSVRLLGRSYPDQGLRPCMTYGLVQPQTAIWVCAPWLPFFHFLKLAGMLAGLRRLKQYLATAPYTFSSYLHWKPAVGVPYSSHGRPVRWWQLVQSANVNICSSSRRVRECRDLKIPHEVSPNIYCWYICK